MPPAKRSTRTYDASRRRAQADRTRADILEAAHRLFVADGYAGTTMTAIAAEAGVSVETVYGGWDGKAGLLKALVTASVRGTEDAVPFAEGEAIQALIAERDPRRQLEIYGRILADVQPRHAPLSAVLREAARSDAKLAALDAEHDADRLEGMTSFAEMLHSRRALAKGIGVARARDILWTMNSTDVYDLLVVHRGWTADEYGTWIAETLASALLKSVQVRDRA